MPLSPHTPNQGNLVKARPIATYPFIVQTLDDDVASFLASLPEPDFETVADVKALWATEAGSAGEGSQYDGQGTAFVTSAEAYRYVKSHRY